MEEHGNGRGGLRVLALMWHSPHTAVTAGGFKRTYEVLKRAPGHVTLHAIDNEPSFLSDLRGGRVVLEEYRIPPRLRALEKRFYRVERMIERLMSFALLVLSSARLKKKGRRFDVILVPYSEIVAMLAAGVVARLIFGCGLVLVNHNIEHFSAPLRKIVVGLHNRADLVIAVSEDLKRRLAKYGVRAPIEVNSNGLDTAFIEEATRGETGEKSYDGVFVGRHVPSKGIDDLVDAWGEVAAKLPGPRLLMLGSCDAPTLARLREKMETLGIDDCVTVGGIVDEGEKFTLISRSKVMLFPSYMEGWGLVPQEGLACGVPVIVYDLPVYKENIDPCGAVFTVRAGDRAALALEAVKLLTDEAYVEYAGEAREYVKKFDWAGIADREFDLLAAAARKVVSAAHD